MARHNIRFLNGVNEEYKDAATTLIEQMQLDVINPETTYALVKTAPKDNYPNKIIGKVSFVAGLMDNQMCVWVAIDNTMFWYKTSPIRSCKSLKDGNIEFQTMNSTYELRVVETKSIGNGSKMEELFNKTFKEGTIISMSKGRYADKYPNNKIIFNAKIQLKVGNKVLSEVNKCDVDLTKMKSTIKELQKALPKGQHIKFFHENSGKADIVILHNRILSREYNHHSLRHDILRVGLPIKPSNIKYSNQQKKEMADRNKLAKEESVKSFLEEFDIKNFAVLDLPVMKKLGNKKFNAFNELQQALIEAFGKEYAQETWLSMYMTKNDHEKLLNSIRVMYKKQNPHADKYSIDKAMMWAQLDTPSHLMHQHPDFKDGLLYVPRKK